MFDPRLSIIAERLKGISEIMAVSSGKGGVGKSLLASVMASTLARKGFKVGLFDLDFTSPSTHLILGVRDAHPTEDKGLVPPTVNGLKYMSIIYYSGNSAAPLRGADVSNAFLELISITRWNELDFLVIDMPPGIGDATLDLIRFIRGTRFLIVTTPSQLAFETVRKLVFLLKELKIPVIGIVENMKMDNAVSIKKETEKLGVKYLGAIPYDATLEEAIGNLDKLMQTIFAKKVEEISAKIG